MTCKIYTLVASDCDCLLKLEDNNGNVIVLNLSQAVVYPILSNEAVEVGFNISTPKAGVNVLNDGSNFDAGDIETLICACNTSSGGGGSVTFPALDVCQHRVVLSGVGTWVRPANTLSVNYFVKEVGDELDPPTLLTSSAVADLFLNESVSWNVQEGQSNLSGTFTITTKADDLIIVVYTTDCSA